MQRITLRMTNGRQQIKFRGSLLICIELIVYYGIFDVVLVFQKGFRTGLWCLTPPLTISIIS